MQKNYSRLKHLKSHQLKKEIFYLIEKDKDLEMLFLENCNFRKFKRPKGFEGLIRPVSYTHLTLPTSQYV